MHIYIVIHTRGHTTHTHTQHKGTHNTHTHTDKHTHTYMHKHAQANTLFVVQRVLYKRTVAKHKLLPRKYITFLV